MRARYDVPLQRDATARFLPLVVGLMVFLGTLAAVGGAVLAHVADHWRTSLTGAATVEIAATPDAEPGEAETRAARALEILAETPGVVAARPLTADEVERLLAPWLGEIDIADLPTPTLIDVEVSRVAPPDFTALGARLAAEIPGARVDDHSGFLGDVLALTGAMELVAALVVALVAAAGVLAVVFATRASLSVHRPVVELMHMMGAADGYIAKQFQRHALGVGFRGGLIGLAAAALTLFGLSYAAGDALATIVVAVEPSREMLAGFASTPVLAAILAAATARRTVMRELKRMP